MASFLARVAVSASALLAAQSIDVASASAPAKSSLLRKVMPAAMTSEKSEYATAVTDLTDIKNPNNTTTQNPKNNNISDLQTAIAETADLKDLVLVAGTANPSLARDISAAVGKDLSPMKIKRFADGETLVKMEESIRGKDVFIIQPTSFPVNDNMMELLLTISTLRRASAGKITAVVPYYGYARQDRKSAPRTPISAADVATLMVSMGVDRVLSVDLHAGQIQGFFPPRVPMDNIPAQELGVDAFVRHLQEKPTGNHVCVVSPDAGGVARAKTFQTLLKQRLGADARVELAMMIKHRPEANKVDRMDLVGSVDGCDAIIVDDMCDTAGTLTGATGELAKHGAKRVFAYITHPVFSGPALERISKSNMEKMFVTDSIVKKDADIDAWPGLREKLSVVKLGAMLGDKILKIHRNQSISWE